MLILKNHKLGTFWKLKGLEYFPALCVLEVVGRMQNFRLEKFSIFVAFIKDVHKQFNKGFFMCFKKVRNLFLVIFGFTSIISCGRHDESKSSSHQGQIGSVQADERTEKRPTYLYKVLSMDDWAKSCKTVHLSSMDADFIHFSTEDQLDKIIEKYWADASEYVVLKIETSKLSGNLVLEANPGGTSKYYHLYNGSIPLDAIVGSTVHKK
jgi:uncharacterized protein (DUF952 family)